METILIQSKSKKHIIENKSSKTLESGLKDLKSIISGKRKAKTLDELLERNSQSQKEIKQGKLIDHKAVKAKFTSK